MNFFSVFGTIGRRDYWVSAVVLFLIAVIGVLFMVNETTAILGLVIIAIVAWVGTALATKRIRDGGCSGWFVILYWIIGLIPYVGFVIQIIWMCLPTGHWDQYNKAKG